jgi:hypothetical protein
MPRQDGNQRGTAACRTLPAAPALRWRTSTDHDGALNHCGLIKIAQATDLLDAGSGSS